MIVSADLVELVRALKIAPGAVPVLMQLADEAVWKFDSDPEAIEWYERELRSRYPDLWWLITHACSKDQQGPA